MDHDDVFRTGVGFTVSFLDDLRGEAGLGGGGVCGNRRDILRGRDRIRGKGGTGDQNERSEGD